MRTHSHHLQHRQADRWPRRPLGSALQSISSALFCQTNRLARVCSRAFAAGGTHRAALLGVALALAAGCGPVTTASVIHDAERDMSEVRSLNGLQNAPYEATKAETYLHKAKELQGYGKYEQASTYARRSRVMSEKAVEVARLAQERNQRKAKFGGRKAKKAAPSFTPSGGGGR